MEKKKRFKLFDSQREGRGIEKSDVYTKTDLKGFFIKYKECFPNLLTVNLLMVLGNFPIIFAFIAMTTATRVLYMAPASSFFPVFRGLFLQEREISASTLLATATNGIQIEANNMTTATYILFGLSLLVIFTFGVVNVGSTYVLRNMAKGDAVFIFSDFFYAITRNWKQALPFGILDLLFLGLITFDLFFLYTAEGSFMMTLFFGITAAVALIYCWMRFYIYLQMVTFDLSLYKLLKNSLIFALLGFKRNIMATLGIILLVVINLFLAFGTGGLLMAAAILLPFVLLFSNGAFMSTYAAYFKIKEIMIDPYENEKPAEEPDELSDDLADTETP